MNSLDTFVKKASRSKFYLFLLNQGLWSKIPFNKPHGFKITAITENGFEMEMPYKRNNLNHIKGLHACGLATISEYVAGLTLLRKVGIDNYRLIMESIHMKYFYQAKMAVKVRFELTDEFVRENVREPLENNDAVMIDLHVNIYDLAQHHICEGTTRWQVKKWDKVKTKV
jgi:acyl-coenzyme A thioesterase PaaI-like protein